MRNQDRTLDFGPWGRWDILQSAAEPLLHVRVESPAGAGPPPQVRPEAEGECRVEAEALEVRFGTKWRTLGHGEPVVVPRGSVHRLQMPGPVRLRNVHRPALDVERSFRRLNHLGAVEGVSALPQGLRSAQSLGMPFAAHGREPVTTSPPQAVVCELAGLGRLRGYRRAA